MADERFGDKLWTVLVTRWWAGLLVGAAVLSGAVVWLHLVVDASRNKAEPQPSVREVLGAIALALLGLSLLVVGLFNLFSRGPSDEEEATERLFDLFFTHWWAGLLVGAASLAGGAYFLWGLSEVFGPVTLSGYEILERAVLGLVGLSFGLVGLCLIPVGVFNLFFRSSSSRQPPCPSLSRSVALSDGRCDEERSESAS